MSSITSIKKGDYVKISNCKDYRYVQDAAYFQNEYHLALIWAETGRREDVSFVDISLVSCFEPAHDQGMLCPECKIPMQQMVCFFFLWQF